MRGFSTAAALLLVPTTVLARATVDASPIDNSFSVAVDVGVTKNTSKTLVFRMDIQESEQACDTAKVRIDGYLLSQDDTGAGQGTFASTSGPAVTANWSFTCNERQDVPWDQNLAITIMSFDGKAVPETSFFVRFQQKGHKVKVLQVGDESMLRTSEDGELKEQIKDTIQLLSSEINDLEGLLEDTEIEIMKKLALKPLPSAAECKDLQCVLRTFSDKAKVAHWHLCNTVEDRWKAVVGCTDDNGNHGDDEDNDGAEDMKPDDKRGPRDDDNVGNYDDYEAYNGLSRHPHRQRRPVNRIPLLLIVAESALTFGFLFYYILRFIRHQVGGRQRSYILPRNISQYEYSEKPVSTCLPPQTTMEEEIASFKEATSLVDDLITMEEGRILKKSQLPKHPGSIPDDDIPPAYSGPRNTRNTTS